MRFESVSYNNTTYRAQDILDSAMRAKVRLDDVKSVSVIFDKNMQKNEEGKDEIRE